MTAALPWTTPHTVDRTGWPPGPWDGEPDLWYEQHGEHAVCYIRRASGGYWCGYVVLMPGHPWHACHHRALPMDADAEWTGYRDGRTWLGWDAGHSWNRTPMHDGDWYVTVREAQHRVRALAAMLETPPADVAEMLRASASEWEREASYYAGDSAYDTHHRAAAIAGRDAALARLAEVIR